MTRWFPIAPGATLPAAPAAVGGQITATKTVPVWNETVLASGISKTKLDVTSFAYALNLLSEVTLQSNAVLNAARSIPAASIALAGAAPDLRTGASVSLPTAAQTFTAVAPDVFSGVSVGVPVTDVVLTALDAETAGPLRLAIQIPLMNTTVTAVAPAVAGGASIASPSTTLSLTGNTPSIPAKDPYFSSVSLLLHMEGANGSIVFTDSSSKAFTVTRYIYADISTSQFKYGSSSGRFYTTGGGIRVMNQAALVLGTGDWTIETWIYLLNADTTARRIWDRNNTTGSIHALAYTSSQLMYFDNTARISVTTPSLNAWHHIAVCRSSGTTTLYVNGIATGGTYADTRDYIEDDIVIGQNMNQSAPAGCYMDEFRLTKGVARYTSDFTPPSKAFPDS